MKIISVFLILIFLVLFGCTNNSIVSNNIVSNDQIENHTVPTTNIVKNLTDNQNLGNSNVINTVKEFVVTGANFKYNPSQIRVSKGDRVKITFIADDMMHDFVIDELSIRTNILRKGQSETLEFTADNVGTFTYYCSVGSHRALGMEGKLIVES